LFAHTTSTYVVFGQHAGKVKKISCSIVVVVL